MKHEVTCNDKSCKYYADGDKCLAKNIVLKSGGCNSKHGYIEYQKCETYEPLHTATEMLCTLLSTMGMEAEDGKEKGK